MSDQLINIEFSYLMDISNRGRAELLRGRTTICVPEVDPPDMQPIWRVSDISSGTKLIEVSSYDNSFWWPVFYDNRRLSQQQFLDLLKEPDNDIVRSLGAPSVSDQQQTLEEYLRSQSRKVGKYDIKHHDECVARLSKGASWTAFSNGLVFFNAGVPALYYQTQDNSLVVGPSSVRSDAWGNHGIDLCRIPGPPHVDRKALARSGLAIGLEELLPHRPALPGVDMVPRLSQRIDLIGELPILSGQVAMLCEQQFFESLKSPSNDLSWEVGRQIRELKRWYDDLDEELVLARDCRTTVRCFAELSNESRADKYRNKIEVARSIRSRLAALGLIDELTDEEARSFLPPPDNC